MNLDKLQSYPTPPESAGIEWMNGDFLKLHPGAMIHYFKDARDVHFHAHPFSFETHVIEGGYSEEVLVPGAGGGWQVVTFARLPGTSHRLPVDFPHRLTGLLGGPCLTRCEYGPTVQKPGFCRIDETGHLKHRFWDESTWKPYRAKTI